jgi:peptidoglycan/LPS O-acetylase OafA/YrhL
VRAPSAEAETGPAGGAATTGVGRVGNVDVLRAAAALGVLAGHAYALGGRTVPIKAMYWWDVPLIQTVSGVWLFFAISGYVIGRPWINRLVSGEPFPDLVTYGLRRALRIFPLYWLALTALIVIAGATGTHGWQFPLHYSLLNNLVPGRQEALFSVAWTLTLEVLFYVAVPVLAYAVRRTTKALTAERLATLIVISWVASILFTCVVDFAGTGGTVLWLRQSFLSMWQMFCPGLLLAVAPHLRARRWRRWLVEFPAQRRALWLAGAVLVAAAVLSSLGPLRFGIGVYQLTLDSSRVPFAVGFGLVLAVAIRSRPWFQRRGRFVLRLGLISYGIYLLHGLLVDILTTDWGHRFIPLPHGGFGAYLVHLVFLLALTIPLAMASWRWLELPCIHLSSRLARRRRKRTLAHVSRA